MDERFKKQMDFILEIDKSKEIIRQTYISSGSRKENDAEHSWHLAVMALLLAEYANEEIDVLRTMSMVLIHDLVEIDAGDTYAYDTAGYKTKRERELKAADRIFNILPKDQAEYMRGLWDEFEAGKTPEARFANSLDKTQPLMLNDAQGGRSWREHGVSRSMVSKRNEHTADGASVLGEYVQEKIDKNVKNKNLIDE
ncbi:MAG: HD domain-containing protein [Lachnospiraceae bacterium]|nr:HD domain-containing protein [Lachnospiraceae bacterium]MBQ9610792.1 HD domain-containing protein [Lachnospiraceae bacterium]